jgi:hypothetical protein
MNSRARLFVVAAVVVLCAVIALTAVAQMQKSSARTVWEYKDGANLQIDQMNAIGEEGWELVQVVTYGRDYYYIFKRAK